jgi:hypothetical protein
MANPGSQNKLLPLLLVLIVVLGIPLLLIAINTRFNFFTLAGPTETPRDMIMANLTANSVTVSFFTPDAQTDSVIKYGPTATDLSQIASDRRDFNSASQGLYSSHVMDLTNLNPSTNYYFKIVIGDTEYNNNGQPFSFKTLPQSEDLATPAPIYGKIDPIVAETLIFSHAIKNGSASTGAQAIIAPNGTFTFDQNSLKDPQTGKQFDLTGAKILSFAESPQGQKGIVLYNSSDLPGTITLTNINATYSTALTQLPDTSAVTATPTVNATTTVTPTPTTIPGTPTPSPLVTPDVPSQAILDTGYSSGAELSDSTVPYEVLVSNINATSFSVSWRTNEPTVGSVSESSPQTKVFIDDRDGSLSSASKRYTHKVTLDISSLAAGSALRFSPVSNGSQQAQTFTFINPALTASPPAPESLDATISKSYTDTNDRDTILYVRKVLGTTKSTWKSVIPASSNVAIPVGDTYTQSLLGYFTQTGASLELRARGETNSMITLTANASTASAVSLQNGLSLKSINQGNTYAAAPAVSGTAAPGATVTVRINNTTNIATASATGNWAVSDPQGLKAGSNQISLISGTFTMGTGFTLKLKNLPGTALVGDYAVISGILVLVMGIVISLFYGRKHTGLK